MSEYEAALQRPAHFNEFLGQMTEIVSPRAINVMAHLGDIVTAKYGSGDAEYDWNHNIEGRAYHHLKHAMGVTQKFLRLAVVLDLPEEYIDSGACGSMGHDIVHDAGHGSNEARSALLTGSIMLEAGFSPRSVLTANLGIIGTEPLFKDGIMRGQAITTLPANPDDLANITARAMASADLGDIFSLNGPLLGHLLFQEQEGVRLGEHPLPLVTDLLDFQRKQNEFLAGYRFPLAEAEEMFTRHKGIIMIHNQMVTRFIEARTPELTWKRIIELDEAFKDFYTKLRGFGNVGGLALDGYMPEDDSGDAEA